MTKETKQITVHGVKLPKRNNRIVSSTWYYSFTELLSIQEHIGKTISNPPALEDIEYVLRAMEEMKQYAFHDAELPSEEEIINFCDENLDGDCPPITTGLKVLNYVINHIKSKRK